MADNVKPDAIKIGRTEVPIIYGEDGLVLFPVPHTLTDPGYEPKPNCLTSLGGEESHKDVSLDIYIRNPDIAAEQVRAFIGWEIQPEEILRILETFFPLITDYITDMRQGDAWEKVIDFRVHNLMDKSENSELIAINLSDGRVAQISSAMNHEIYVLRSAPIILEHVKLTPLGKLFWEQTKKLLEDDGENSFMQFVQQSWDEYASRISRAARESLAR